MLLLAASWPFAVLLMNRPVWSTFPAITIRLAIFMALYVAGIVITAALAPRLTMLLAALAGAAIALQLWRARPTFGRSRDLPPGSLALAPAQMWLDPNFFLKQYRRYGPIFKTSHFLHPTVCIIGFETAFDVLSRYEHTGLRAPAAPFSRYIPCGFIRSMSPEDHSTYRPILKAAVSSVVTDSCAPETSAAVVRCLERMAEECTLADSGQSLKNYAEDPVYELLFRMFFGIVPGSRESMTFRDIYKVLDLAHRRHATRVWSPSDRLVNQALREVYAHLNQRIQSFENTQTNPPESYLEAAWRHGGPPAVNEVVMANMIFLLQASCTDLVGLFQWILKNLSVHPEWQRRLREVIREHGKDSAAATEFADRIVAETYRMEQSEHIYRKVVKPIRIGKFRVPKGWLLRICVRETHRSSSVFENPETFNPDRFLNRSYGPTEYAPFGLYRKRCIGVHTVIRIGGIFVKELLDGYEWQVTDEGTQDYVGWHWTPGTAFAVSLKRR